MGCFRACFGKSKRPKPRKFPVQIPPSNHGFKASEGVCALGQAKEVVEVPSIDLNKDSLDKLEEKIELCHTAEKTYPIVEDDEIAPTKVVENNLDEIKKEGKIGRREDDESRGSSNLSTAFSLPLNHRYRDCPNSDDDDEYVEELDNLDEEEKIKDRAEDYDHENGKNKLLIEQESSESLFSLSLSSRTQVCTVEAGENEVNSLDPRSCFPDIQPDKALSDKNSRCRYEISVRTVQAGENEVNSPDPSHCSPDIQPSNKASSDKKLRSPYENVDSVLNPIENVNHCLNAAKLKTLPPVHLLEKENIINLDQDCDVIVSPEPSFLSKRKLKENRRDLKPVEDEIAVNTSLSNWLVESETTPKSKSSTSSIGNSPMWTKKSATSWLVESETTPKSKSSTSSIGNSPMWTKNSATSYEDRPILGALTLEELRQFSALSTPRQLRSRSPEETPIIGTVGSYWSHTGQDADLNQGSSCQGSTKTTRKSREDERVNWNSTPFLERLDMALASNSAEV